MKKWQLKWFKFRCALARKQGYIQGAFMAYKYRFKFWRLYRKCNKKERL